MGKNVQSQLGMKRAQFKISFSNIRGLHANLDHVHHFLLSHKPDILALTESQILTPPSDIHLHCPGYILVHNFVKKGGLCIFIKSNIACKHLSDLDISDSRFQSSWIKVSSPDSSKFICTIYRSPNDSQTSSHFLKLSQQIEAILSDNPHSEICLLGDFNCHNSSWLSHSFSTDAAGREIYDFSILNSLSQLVNSPTRVPDRSSDRPQTLDLFLTSHPSNYSSVSVAPPIGNSDHNLISLEHSISSSCSNSGKRTIWKFGEADWEGLRNFFSSLIWNDIISWSDVNKCSSQITEFIMCGMELYIPHKTVCAKPNNPRWFSAECKSAVAAKNKAYQAYKQSRSAQSREHYIIARNNCNDVVRNSKSDFIKSIANKVCASPSYDKRFWSLAKKIGSNFCSSSFPTLCNVDGNLIASSQEKSEAFAKFFASTSTLPPSDLSHPGLSFQANIISDVKITTRKVRKAFFNIDTCKAVGPDNISPIVLKKCYLELSPVFSRLFRLSLKAGVFPTVWKTAHVVPIHKKGDRSCVSNYRPISITSCISKVFESIINEHVLDHIEKNNLISDSQYGFRKARSTGDLLTYASHMWSSAAEAFGETRAVSLDVAKAFDRVWHSGLIAKLPSYGFSPSLIAWLENYLQGRSLAVRVDGVLSSEQKFNSGVPQGCILSPTLFIIFINDLLEASDVNVSAYADDTTLHCSTRFRSQADCRARLVESRVKQSDDLNASIIKVLDWGSKNRVQFNASKTQSIFISSKRSICPTATKMDGVTLSDLDDISLLGVKVSSNLSWNKHINSIAKNACRKLNFLFRARHYFRPQEILLLYKAQIRPLLEYSSHIWGAAPDSVLNILNKVQDRAVRLIGDPSVSNSLSSLSHRRSVGELCLFYRYYFGHCSSQIAGCVPPPLQMSSNRTSRLTNSSHNFAVAIGTSRSSIGQRSFFSRVGKLWNSLPSSVFPAEFDLQKFKSKINQLQNL